MKEKISRGYKRMRPKLIGALFDPTADIKNGCTEYILFLLKPWQTI
ncbi:MAG: hypothetical protein M3270_08730 [Thermoproteota archaeon]|nr:hypothetical protein [Thermoproteota archaeon]